MAGPFGPPLRNGATRYNDELFFYDINGHRWICCYPGTNLDSFKVKLNADGFEVDETGQPLPVGQCAHTYSMNTYDTHRRKFMTGSVPTTYVPKVVKDLRAANHGDRKINWTKASPWRV